MEQAAGALNLPPAVWNGVADDGYDLGPAAGGPPPVRYLEYPPNLELPVHLQIAASPPLFQPSEGWPVRNPVAACIPEDGVAFCGCQAKAVQWGCNRSDCRNCEDFVRRRRAMSIRERFEAGRKGKPVIYTILTVPEERRQAAANPKTWAAWRRRIVKWMKKNVGFHFGLQRSDPAGDEAPDKWHPHVNLLWVQRDGFTPFIDVDTLREEWARIIEAPLVNVWTQYSTDDAKLRHWYSYMGRPWPDWQNSVRQHLRMNWLGAYPRKPPPEKKCCEKCGEKWRRMLCGTEVEARRLAALGPERLRDEADWRDFTKAAGGFEVHV